MKGDAKLPKEIDKRRIPQPVDLTPSEPVNRLEDQLRAQKERDLMKKQKDEIEQQNLLEVLMTLYRSAIIIYEQQAREQKMMIQKALAEMKHKNYTFDYDGKMIVCKSTPIDKLPPTAHTVE